MVKNEVMERLQEIFADVFDDDSIEITESTSADDIADWDSITHITLIASVETEFSMKFTMDEIMGLKNIGEMVDVILKRAKK